MRLATLRRSRSEPPLPGLHGPARVERRAAALARRARPGDIAVLEHLDLDGTSARMLLDKVSSTDVREVLLEDSYHVATLDNDAPVIFENSLEFVRRLTRTSS